MRKIFTTISTFLICGMMLAPVADAQSRGRGRSEGGGNSHRTESPSRNPGGGHNQGNNRPGGQHNQGNNRPGDQHNQGNNRPGGQHNQGNNRPGDNYYNPGHNQGHNPGHNPGHVAPPPAPVRPNPPRPQYGHYHRPPYVAQPPIRPYMPVNRPWARPVPPPGWRPYHGAPTWTGVLGVIFGTALDVTLNSLLNSGYTVTNYGPSAIYLTSVPLLNYSWPNATVNFVNGVMRGSEFTYSTPYYDLNRYNNIYSQLVARYGSPVSLQNNGQSMSATWWGYDNGYITLNFFTDYAYNGTMRYFTTLSVGN